MSGSPKARLYFIDNPSNETTTIFTFPDGQKILINVGFSKLFSDSYKNLLRGSFANDHGLQLVDFEGSSIINLVDLYPFDRSRLDLQVLHPCDMICHDVKGTVVQFKQILLQSGSLSTLMAPEQPVLDVSVTIPCEVMCIDRRGERRQFSTTLKRVLRAGDERTNQLDPDLGGLRGSKLQFMTWNDTITIVAFLYFKLVRLATLITIPRCHRILPFMPMIYHALFYLTSVSIVNASNSRNYVIHFLCLGVMGLCRFV